MYEREENELMNRARAGVYGRAQAVSAAASFFHAAIWILLSRQSLSSSSSIIASSSVLGSPVEGNNSCLMAPTCSSVAITFLNHSAADSLGAAPGGRKLLITCANVCDACMVA